MKFGYYKQLGPAQQRTYDHSDAVAAIELPDAAELAPLVRSVADALAAENRAATEAASHALARAMTDRLRVSAVEIRVLSARPNRSYGELHGLYESDDPAAGGRITLWMQTAKKKQVVAFKTFLRTFLHELGHHLDYTLLRLRDSYHTEGFFKRESSLYHQLVADGSGGNNP